MKLKALEKIRALNATPKMMKLAAEDTPRKVKRYGREYIAYTHGMYMRCLAYDGILKVAFFFTEPMRIGARQPAYELFVLKESRQFITFDRMHGKWLNSKLDRLDWPEYIYYSDAEWIDPSDDSVIKQYLGSDMNGYDALLQFQLNVREEQLLKRHKRETDPWDADLKQVPPLPKDWDRWVSKVGVRENFIYYHYSRKGADTGYCTFCEKDVPIRMPRHNTIVKCSCCRRIVTFKSAGRAAGVVLTRRNQRMYLLQRCKDGFIIREFEGYRRHLKETYKEPQSFWHEVHRVIYDTEGKALRAYYWGQYKNRYYRWNKSELFNPDYRNYWSDYGGQWDGKVYGKTLPHLAKMELSRTGLFELLRDTDAVDPERYLGVLDVVPQLERFAKAGLPDLVHRCLSNYKSFQKSIHNINASGLKEMLGINTQELKRLRQYKGGLLFLDWLRLENVTGNVFRDKDIAWLCSEEIKPKDVEFIRNKMSIQQICNYIRRQMSISREPSKDIITTWADYLSMAKRFNMDTDDEIIFRVTKLRQRHDELVERCHGKGIALRAGEIIEKFPHVDEICGSLSDKYEYADGDYTILAPTRIEDILKEGENLHHCLDKSDRYWERIERRETYVLFLRRSSDIGMSYYTLEVEPNGTVRQTRTKYDRQLPDLEDARSFLRRWQTVISQRLTHEDQTLAKESRILREQNFAQLREEQKIIYTGDLAGQLLVDVLLADLLEAAVV